MARRYGRQGIPDNGQSLDATTGVEIVHTRKGQIPGTCGDRIHDRIGRALVHTADRMGSFRDGITYLVRLQLH